MIDFHILERAARHPVDQRIVRILDDRQAALILDRNQAGGAIVERAGEHDPDHARPVRISGGSKERIDRRPVSVLARPADHSNVGFVQQQVVIRAGDVDAVGNESFAIVRVLRGHRTCGAEDARKHALVLRSEVQDDEDRGAEVRRQVANEPPQRLDSAGGSTDDDDVAPGHSVQSTPACLLSHASGAQMSNARLLNTRRYGVPSGTDERIRNEP